MISTKPHRKVGYLAKNKEIDCVPSVERMIDAALASALASPGVSGRIRMGAAIYDKKHLVSVGNNSYKTHPKVLSYRKYAHLHAEQAAILRAGLDNCHGTTLVVARIKKDGSWGLSKPCLGCEAFARDVGIKSVIFTCDDGTYQTQKLN